jgi:hypothetical protein
MPRWEYAMIHLSELPRGTDEIDILNDAGEDGWELVSIVANNVAHLKRQITASAAPTVKSTPRLKRATNE